MLHPKMRPLIIRQLDPNRYLVSPENRGIIKQVLTSIGFPAYDKAGYVDGEPFEITLRKEMLSGGEFKIREYQKLAAENFIGSPDAPGGSGEWCFHAGPKNNRWNLCHESPSEAHSHSGDKCYRRTSMEKGDPG
jgi:hypothetical protein